MKNLPAIDASSILHPATNADDFARTGSKIIESGKGIYLKDHRGKKLIDAVGSNTNHFFITRQSRLSIAPYPNISSL